MFSSAKFASGCQKALLVGKPIRALNDSSSESGSPLREIAPEPEASVVSKYFDQTGADDLLVNISQKDQFTSWKHDPIFAVRGLDLLGKAL